MNTKFRNSEEIQKAFQGLLQIHDEKEDIAFQSQMLMYRFLSEVEILMERNNMTKKELAEKIGTSASYITQLYRGNKPLNMETIAKFQKVFSIMFEIKARPKFLSEKKHGWENKINSEYTLPAIDMNSLLNDKVKSVQQQMAQEPRENYKKKIIRKAKS